MRNRVLGTRVWRYTTRDISGNNSEKLKIAGRNEPDQCFPAPLRNDRKIHQSKPEIHYCGRGMAMSLLVMQRSNYYNRPVNGSWKSNGWQWLLSRMIATGFKSQSQHHTDHHPDLVEALPREWCQSVGFWHISAKWWHQITCPPSFIIIQVASLLVYSRSPVLITSSFPWGSNESI